MAKLDVAQINYLSQDLIIHIQNAQNLIGQGTFELDRAQKTLKMLLNAQDQWMRETDGRNEIGSEKFSFLKKAAGGQLSAVF